MIPMAQKTTPPSAAAHDAEARDLARKEVRALLQSSAAFQALPANTQREIANHTVQVAEYLAAPEGIHGNTLLNARSANARSAETTPPAPADPYALGLAQDPARSQRSSARSSDDGKFTAQSAREGATVAGQYLSAVDFPNFVAQLIKGVFHAIVQASMEQMEAYGKLVADVAKTLNQFRDDNVSENQGRDHLVDQFPDLFRLDVDTGAEGGPAPRVRVREGVDEDTALQRVNGGLPLEGGALTSLDDDAVEEKLVPAARTQLATSRQQLLATMVLMGINRIVVTDGRIAAKVLFDFTARDNFKFQKSATRFDYGDQYRTTSSGDYETNTEGGETTSSYSKDQGYQSDRRDANYYAKGAYKTTTEPILNLMSASQAATDAQLSTKASLSGQVDINFKSETYPLEKMADSFQIGRIQDAAKPGPAARSSSGQSATGAASNTGASSNTPAAQPTAPAAKP